jgi:hypothetical protein
MRQHLSIIRSKEVIWKCGARWCWYVDRSDFYASTTSFQEVKMGLPVGRQEVAVDMIRDCHLDAHMWHILAHHHNRRVNLDCFEVFIKG